MHACPPLEEIRTPQSIAYETSLYRPGKIIKAFILAYPLSQIKIHYF